MIGTNSAFNRVNLSAILTATGSQADPRQKKISSV